MYHLLVLLLCSSGLQAEGEHTSTEHFRLVGGASRCAGTLEVKHQGQWRPVVHPWTLKIAAGVCRESDCGSVVSVEERESSFRSVWMIRSDCVLSGSALRECAESVYSSSIRLVTCSDSVRLVNGTSLCSGRLEVKTNQSTQRWSSVCEDDFDQQDAEVVCRELGCGAPSVLQGVLYGEVEAPMWTKEFQCIDSVRLVGGASRCAGTLEVKQGEWRPVGYYFSAWTLKTAAAACRELDCGSAVSIGQRVESTYRSVWTIRSDCVESGSALRECAVSASSSYILDLTCSEPSVPSHPLSDPPLDPSEPSSGPSEPSSDPPEPSEPSHPSSDPPSDPSEPSSEPSSDPSSDQPSDPPDPSSDPSSEPSPDPPDPSSDPSSEPSSDPSDPSDPSPDPSTDPSDPSDLPGPAPFIIGVVVLSLTLLLVITALSFYCKASRGQKSDRENIELYENNLGVPEAEGGLTEEEGEQRAE